MLMDGTEFDGSGSLEEASGATPALSVVVIGRNEGRRLLECLESVRAMQGPGPVQTIYVDSGSTDGSVAAAKEAGVHVIALGGDCPTAAKGRNAGWHAATATTVLFLDGDTLLHPHFVAEALPSFQDPSVAVVWGHRRERFPEHSVYNRVLDLDWVYRPGPAAFCGGDALFRRAVLEETGGFDERLIAGEEPELCRRMLGRGRRILHVDLPMTGHDLAVTRFSQYWRRAMRAGYAYAEVAARFRGTPQPFWSDAVVHNRERATVLLGSPVVGLAASLLLHRAWPLLLVAAGLLVVALRTAWQSRWKSRNLGTLLLYGVHCHVQQIPILMGQMSFARDRRAGRRAGLIEYKRFLQKFSDPAAERSASPARRRQ